MVWVMMSIRTASGPPTPEAIRHRYALADDDVDAAFGVVPVDPEDGVYTVMVEESAAPRLVSGGGWTVSGPFSNPRIAPAGPG